MNTTIKLSKETKSNIDNYREYKNESYDEILNKLLFIAKNALKKPEISQETAKDIQKARERIKKGLYVSEADAKKRLGL